MCTCMEVRIRGASGLPRSPAAAPCGTSPLHLPLSLPVPPALAPSFLGLTGRRLQGHAHGKILESLSVTPGTEPGLSVFGHRFGHFALFNIIKKALGRKWEYDRTYSCYILCAPQKPGNPKNYPSQPNSPCLTIFQLFQFSSFLIIMILNS